ncbi:MAG: hypothetical protein Q8R37_02875 [Nanoarchaeota archaeon]|nr:hypothetical protein [Nanoarchaeota archaeon]
MAGSVRDRLKDQQVKQGMDLVERTEAFIKESCLFPRQAAQLYTLLRGYYAHAIQAHNNDVTEDLYKFLSYLEQKQKKYE